MDKGLKPLTLGLACVLGAGLSAPIMGDALYVRGDFGFLADGDLYILDLAKIPPEELEAITIGNATDVTVENCRAAVTTTDPLDGSKGVAVVDLSGKAYLGEGFCNGGDSGDDGDSEDGDSDSGSGGEGAVYDSHKGVLTVPCVDVDGVYYTILMEQRGGSNNWKLTFAEPAETCGE